MQNKAEISAEVLRDELAKDLNLKLIDVRSPGEFNSIHIDGSINLPLGSESLSSLKNNGTFQKDQKIVLVCQSGARADKACEEIVSYGFQNIKILQGGIGEWDRRGYLVIKGRGAISLERQVRIAAGSMVFASSILVVLGVETLVFLPIFVGAGLIFSGVTNTCGMGRVLAYMPWNMAKIDSYRKGSSDVCCDGGKSCQK